MYIQNSHSGYELRHQWLWLNNGNGRRRGQDGWFLFRGHVPRSDGADRDRETDHQGQVIVISLSQEDDGANVADDGELKAKAGVLNVLKSFFLGHPVSPAHCE